METNNTHNGEEFLDDPEIFRTNQFLSILLDAMRKVDFTLLASKRKGDITAHEYHILVVDQVLLKCKQNRLDIAFYQEQFYVYDQRYWSTLTESVIRFMLAKSAVKMGLNSLFCTHYTFVDHLLEQLRLQALPPVEMKLMKHVKINVRNGTVHFIDGKPVLLPHNKDDFMTYILDFDFDPAAKSVLFLNTLEELIPEPEARAVFGEYLGTSFLPKYIFNTAQVLFLFGPGGTGKSFLADIIIGLLSQVNVSTFSLPQLTGESSYERAIAGTKLINWCTEASTIKDVQTLKQLSAQDNLMVRLPYQQPYSLDRFPKIIINANSYPKETESSNAFFRRILMIPMLNIIPPEKQDKQLAQKIIQNKQELAGILNWICEGVARILQNKEFTKSNLIQKAVQEYQTETDNVKQFIQDEWVVRSAKNKVELSFLYDRYTEYCKESGYHRLSKSNFKRRMIDSGFEHKRLKEGNIFYIEFEDPISKDVPVSKMDVTQASTDSLGENDEKDEGIL